MTALHGPKSSPAVFDLRVATPEEPLTIPKTVAVIGLGYVGLPTAVAFEQAGATVIGVDTSVDRLAAIAELSVDLLPRDLERLRASLDRPRLVLTHLATCLPEAGAIIVCVPTPVDEHRAPDLGALQTACDTVVGHARPGQTIVLSSTTYVGCTRQLLVEPLEGRGFRVGEDVFVAFSPERIDPGNEQFPADQVPRIVGGVTPACAERARALVSAIAPVVHVVSSAEAAEMTKLYENTFRAVNIALANELATVSHGLELDAVEVIDAAATKPYGFLPFYPGPGVGGHCIPCDPHYLIWQLRPQHRRAPLVEAAMCSIDERPDQVVDRAAAVLAGQGKPLSGARVLLVGVAYKPGVADVRESPALQIMSRLLERGAEPEFVDPFVPEVRLTCGRRLEAIPPPCSVLDHHLVLVHTIHPGVDHGWIAEHPLVLDATYRLALSHRHVV